MKPEVLTLVKLFAENNLSDIESDIAPLIKKYFNKDWTITKEEFYAKNYFLIKEFKKVLETINTSQQVLDAKAQVKECLSYFWKKANFNKDDYDTFKYKMSLYSQLVFFMFEKKWSKSQMEHFTVVSEMFRDYNNYFISYTNHFAPVINSHYIAIYKNLLNSEYSDDELDKKNLLAKAFYKFFGMRNLGKGFFDRDSIRISDLISEKVKQNAEKSIVLVQLLSKASFEYTEPNWSYTEYSEYLKSRNKPEYKQPNNEHKTGFAPHPFFVLIEQNPYPLDTSLLPDDYESWMNHSKTQALHHDFSAVKDYTEFTTQAEQLIKDIIKFRSNIIGNVPD